MENSEDRVDATTAPAGVEQLQGTSSAKKGSETTAVKATVPHSKMVRANTAIGMASLSQAKQQDSMVVLQQPNCSANVIDDNLDGSDSGAAANSANLRLQPSKSGVELNRISRLKSSASPKIMP